LLDIEAAIGLDIQKGETIHSPSDSLAMRKWLDEIGIPKMDAILSGNDVFVQLGNDNPPYCRLLFVIACIELGCNIPKSMISQI
jgi:hypothetical protein